MFSDVLALFQDVFLRCFRGAGIPGNVEPSFVEGVFFGISFDFIFYNGGWSTSANNMQRKRYHLSSFTLIELLMVIALLSMLATLVVPALDQVRQRARVSRAVVEVRGILLMIDWYRAENHQQLPDDLQQLYDVPPVDPWGNEYVYNNFENIPYGWVRKDRNQIPINEEFDLYSKGRDGKSAPALTAQSSWDDVIVANDGLYIGLGKNY